ncbi:membrane carboxypeptidase (penicillin-binding protein) [Lactobacillus selangorensis]|uniref:Membrane carboxypeptidase (Penicillin-binding protein) n=1 Tax=Lactobacillus selangorensis TaxID=81857 RepID=A0A0R2FZL6_9LACO|nr:PBP1A family penicillin-binding protein [Lactobacillus selangorensis]KRN29493.1 membrane carboxypeptidase (penicillin-binding protein) [Lactobacillus selangorensis]KRN33977.1 membrane carboxypeptidase (penicillin-binding protein) [Lactobacillus selangorensis]
MAGNNQSGESRLTRRKPKRRSPWRKFFWGILIFFGVILVSGSLLFAYYAHSAPTLDQEKLVSGGASTLYDSDGKAFKTLGYENRDYVKSADIPATLKNAVVSIEDRRFYKEPFGIDPIRIIGAAISDVTGSSGLQGGSTLTQQLVKLSFFSTKASDQTIKRKAQEAWLALQVERKYSKDQILEYYINKVYMGNGIYGMGTAAQYYFGKSLSKLDLAQFALLAGMPQSPTGYDPYTHADLATQRRNSVLQAMERNKVISASQEKNAEAESISTGLVDQATAKNQTTNDAVVDPYVKEVINQVKADGFNPYTDGLKIYTNINLDAQKHLYNLVNNDSSISFPSDKFQTAVTITNPNNGQVVAQIGARKTGDTQLGLNRAVQTSRSNGSTMKPLMDYAPAIEYLNESTYTQLEDTKYTYPGTDIQLYDWDKKYEGKMSMRTALVTSRNVPAIRTLSKVGITRATQFLSGLGINLTQKEQVASTGIGGYVSTLQEAAAYGAFANGGTYYKPRYVKKVVTADNVVHHYKSKGTQAMESSTAYMITDMLKGVFTGSGTGVNYKVGDLYEAGKTGTTDYSDSEIKQNSALGATGMAKDSWFTGYTRNNVISVWTGYDKSSENGLDYSEQKIAGEIYKNMMTYISQDETNKDWKKPSNVVARNIVKNSDPAQVASKNASSSTYTRELFIKGTQPGSTTITDSESTSSAAESNSESNRDSSQSQSVTTFSQQSSATSTSDSSSQQASSSESASSSSTAATSSTPTEQQSSSSTTSTSTEAPATQNDNTQTQGAETERSLDPANTSSSN